MPDDPTQPYDPEEELASAIQSSEPQSNEELSEILRQRFSSEQGESGAEGETSATPPPAPIEEPPPTPTPTPSAPEFYDLPDGTRLDRDTIQTYADFHKFLEDNPEFAEVSKRAFESIKSATVEDQTPVAVKPPEELDLEDPTIKAMWDVIQAQDSRLNNALQRLASVDTTIQTQTEATTESLVNRGVASFKQQNKLTDEQMTHIRETAARLEILPALMNPVDPVTGLARKVDPLAAIEQSLEYAMWTIPEYRDRAVNERIELKAKEDDRKRKLSKLGGSSGSVPRTAPVPTTKEDRQKAMIAELSEAMFGPSQSNEE